MRPQDALELRSDPLHRAARTLVARVGVQADGLRLPELEGVAEHEPLHLGVRRGADRGASEPGGPDLADVGGSNPVPGVALGPRPPHQIPEPGGADDRAVGKPEYREWRGRAGVALGQRSLDVLRGRGFALRHGAQLVEGGVTGGRLGQAGGVPLLQWLEPDVPPVKAGEEGGHR